VPTPAAIGIERQQPEANKTVLPANETIEFDSPDHSPGQRGRQVFKQKSK
jgi:hypothetical protein